MANQLIDYWKTCQEIRFEDFEGKPGRIINARLLAGSDLLDGIVAVARKYQIRAGIVSVCFGSLSKTAIRWEERTLEGPRGDKRSPPRLLDGPITFLSAQGKVGVPRQGEPLIHMHGVVADTSGRVWGGHLFPGENPTFSTMDIVIQEIEGIEFDRILDPETKSALLRARKLE
ncbi:MAG: DNA-binding protein [Acidobacteria bacterium]|jgi:predicted DNA-binding protein with PD1-like motif|nr:DNA-binding protein [Acidobacteriota bacterium]